MTRYDVISFGAAVLLAATFTACSGGPPAAQPDLELSFIQQRVDEGTPRAQLRVISREGAPIVVTGIGLDWPGYGEAFSMDYDTTIQAGRTLDLRMVLPDPDCSVEDPGRVAAVGSVEAGGMTVRDRLDESGQGALAQVERRRQRGMHAVRPAIETDVKGITSFHDGAHPRRIELQKVHRERHAG